MPDADGLPVRIRMSRRKGWRLPATARYVGRPTFWGNPYRAGSPPPLWPEEKPFTAADAVDLYRVMVAGGHLMGRDPGATIIRRALAELAGFDLACWCPLDQVCHADVLLSYTRGVVL